VTQIDPQAQALLDRWAAIPGGPVGQLTAAKVREDDLSVLELQREPDPSVAVDDIELAGPAGAMAARVYRLRHGRRQAVLYLHGGGFVIGPGGYEAPLCQLARASGCLIVALRCRLAPEHRFPAAVEDAVAGARWLAANAGVLGGAGDTVGVVGDSSGGNLAAVVAQTLTRDGVPLSFQALIYPMLDATASSASYGEFASGYGFTREKARWYFHQYLPPEVDAHAPRVSPLFERQLAGLPPTLIVTAECDPLRDEGETYAGNLRRAGVEVELRRYPGMIHGFFQMTAALDAARRLHDELGRWLKSRSAITCGTQTPGATRRVVASRATGPMPVAENPSAWSDDRGRRRP
jgi:acetyl esterase